MGSAKIIGSWVAAVAAAAAFFVSTRRAAVPVIDLKMFRSRVFSASNIAIVIAAAILGIQLLGLSLFLQQSWHWSTQGGPVTTMEEAAALARNEHGLVVVATLRGDETIQSSLINAGIVPHPATGESTLAFVTNGPVKLANLRARPQVTATFRNGWQWAAVEGHAELAGPTIPSPGSTERLRLLLREIFSAAGGEHDDWDTHDRAMAEERRAAALVRPDRVYTNR
jgi:PPOX class probable F420-dependent enzyme